MGLENTTNSRFIRFHQNPEAIRMETVGDTEFMVLPAIALVEGVLHAANAPNPELSLASEFGKFPLAWNGRPVTLDHPQRGGNFVSASQSPQIFEEEKVGTVHNARMDGNKLKVEFFVDPKRVPAEEIERFSSGSTVEVSTGFFAEVFPVEETTWEDGRVFNGVQTSITPDHIAILNKDSIGACSVEDGCGVPRLNQSEQPRVNTLDSNGDLVVQGEKPKDCGCGCNGKGKCKPSSDMESTAKTKMAQFLLDKKSALLQTLGGKPNEGNLINADPIPVNAKKSEQKMAEKQELIQKIVDLKGSPFKDAEVLNLMDIEEIEYIANGGGGTQPPKKQSEAPKDVDDVVAPEGGGGEQPPKEISANMNAEAFVANGEAMKHLPTEVQDLITRTLAEEKKAKIEIVDVLVNAKYPEGKDSLMEKDLDTLKKLSKWAEDTKEADFSALGAPVVNSDVNVKSGGAFDGLRPNKQ